MPPSNNTLSEGLVIAEEKFENLRLYDAMLHKWQKAINLVSPTTLSDSWNRHILDSAQLSAHLPQGHHVLADLGCGGGFPGLVLAMLNPDLEVYLIESDEKKCQFMRSVSRETKTKVSIHTQRIEKSYDLVTPSIVTARALAALDKLLGYCLPWALKNPDLIMFLMKGERAEEEVEKAREIYNFKCDFIQSQTEAHAKILKITALKLCE